MKRRERHFGHREAKWPTSRISQSDGSQAVVASDLDREPPFAVREAVGRREAAQFVPTDAKAASATVSPAGAVNAAGRHSRVVSSTLIAAGRMMVTMLAWPIVRVLDKNVVIAGFVWESPPRH